MKQARFSKFFGPGEDETGLLADYVAEGLGIRSWPVDSVAALGCFADDLVGATIFHDWQPERGTISLSGYGPSPGWMTLQHIYLMHWYVFDGARCRLSVLQVSSENRPMRSIAEKFGYEGTRIPRLRGDDEAEIVYTLNRDEWKSNPFTQRVEARAVV